MVLEGWERAPLSDFAEEIRDRLDPSEEPELPYVGLANVEPQHRQIPEFDVLDAVASTKTRFRTGDVLFGKLRPYLHKVAQADRDGAASTDIMVIRPTDGVHPGFLYWRLTSTPVVRWATRHSAGTKMPRTSWSRVREFVVPLPPLGEQRKIAAILSSVDDAIAATRKVIDQTKRMKKGLLQTLMTRGIGHAGFKQTAIGEIPEQWEVLTLSSVASVERGKFTARPRNDPRYYGGGIPFVQTGDVTDSDVVLASHTQTLNEAGLEVSRLFPAGTILITIAANIGEVAQAAYPVAFPDSVVGIQAGDRVDGRWLLYLLETRKKYLNQVATQNAQKNINLEILRPLRLPVPGLSEQRGIASRLDSLSEVIRESEALLGSLQTLKRGLMQDLLTGRVRVQPD